jgi:3'-phosphoadenosine 5'-phosphosulfate sulfotransferase (PAPS reductase)/FAD synthetase
MHKDLVWSYGGGTQSIAIAVLIFQGKLPKPDHIVFADTGREATETFHYYDVNLKGLMLKHGMQVETASHELSKVDLYSSNGDLLIPVFTATGKLPTFCSSEWKKRVVRRYLRSIGVDNCDMWLGFSTDEVNRLKDSDVKWTTHVYPLCDLNLSREQCRQLILDYGLPEPPKSSCWMCPHRNNEQWRYLLNDFPEDWNNAVKLDYELREKDPELFLHRQRVPLDKADLSINAGNNELGCQEGSCFT